MKYWLRLLALGCFLGPSEWLIAEPPTAADRQTLQQRAEQANQRGDELFDQGRYAEAVPWLKQALTLRQQLYPPGDYPDGHEELALTLNDLGVVLRSSGAYSAAEPYLQQALAIRRKLYPKTQHPNGHPLIATSLTNLAALLESQGRYTESLAYREESLAMSQKLYPHDQYPLGHPDVARGLHSIGYLLESQGELAKAQTYYEQALAMRRQLYPKERFPQGHPLLASSLHNLGGLLINRGEPGRALLHLQESLQMRRQLYPASRFPDGHPDLAMGLNALAMLHLQRKQFDAARPLLEQTLAMRRRLYPKSRYPAGHPQIATSLHNLGYLHLSLFDPGEAKKHLEEALAMNRELYPSARYPEGHFALASSLTTLAGALKELGQTDRAEKLCHEALDMLQKLYPATRYPDGHPAIAAILGNLSHLAWGNGDMTRAKKRLEDAMAIERRLFESAARLSSEAQALNSSVDLANIREVYLSLTHAMPDSIESAYTQVFPLKGVLARIVRERHRLWHSATEPALREQLTDWIRTRRQLSEWLLMRGLPVDDPERTRRLKDLTRHKERLERELARAMPEFAALSNTLPTPTDLLARLGADEAFVDVYRYRIRSTTRIKPPYPARYALFVVQPGQPIRRADVDAAPIDKALEEWHKALSKHAVDTTSPAHLRRLLWDQLALPQTVRRVHLSPDGLLAVVPWAALPGRQPGTILLEDCTISLSTSGPALVHDLTPTRRQAAHGGLLLTGDVAFGENAQGQSRPWSPLPSSAQEVQAIERILTDMKTAPKCVTLTKAEATVGRVMTELPKARWVHLATHGFFASRDSRDLDALYHRSDFLMFGNERYGSAARNPLSHVGLALAEANRDNKNILTGETLAGLNLSHLELAVLSACETGLGEATYGEGVLGLVRAFQGAGCRNVVASLWRVDDAATTALMVRFYHELWTNHQSPREALRRAQLHMHYHPADVTVLASARRGPDFSKVVNLDLTPPIAVRGEPAKRGAVHLWAAFALAGPGS